MRMVWLGDVGGRGGLVGFGSSRSVVWALAAALFLFVLRKYICTFGGCYVFTTRCADLRLQNSMYIGLKFGFF